MILYHVDRGNLLQPNTTLELDSDFTNFDPELREYLVANFPEGVSEHGKRYISEFYPCDYEGGLNKAFIETSSYITESTLELLRKAYFPDHPSRFQSLFAFDSLDKIWDDFKKYPIYEIEVDEDAYKVYDASFLISPFICRFNLDSSVSLSYNQSHIWNYQWKYLNQESSDDPEYECVVSFPIKVLNKVDIIY